jgi:hypothetical protein
MWKTAIVVGLICLFLASASYALDPIGPPKAFLGQGHWSLGVEYAHTDIDTEPGDTVSPWAPYLSRSFHIDRAYANVRYGVCSHVDLFARLGATAFEQDIYAFGPGFQGGADFAWGLGGAVTLYREGKLDIGLLAQYSHGESSEDAGPIGDEYHSEIEVQTVQVAAGPTYQLQDDLAAYGGLFAFTLDGEYDGILEEWDFDANSAFGLFAGLNWEIKEDALLNVEFQYVGSGFAVATGLRWMFE